jgi:hypothetical protein
MSRINNIAKAFCLMAASLALMGAFLACSLGAAASDSTKYTIVNKSTGGINSTYVIPKGQRRASEINCYGADRKLRQTYVMTYDSAGNLSSMKSSRKTLSGAAPITTENSFTYAETRDADGKLTKVVQTSNDGQTVEANYGYEAGVLRGYVQTARGNTVMKDYPQ